MHEYPVWNIPHGRIMQYDMELTAQERGKGMRMRKEIPSEQKWKRACAADCFWWMICNPFCILMYLLSWKHLYSLCMYGSVRRNLLILALCLTFWLGFLISLHIQVRQSFRNGTPLNYEVAAAQEEELVFKKLDYETGIGLNEVRHYRLTKKRLDVMAAGGRFFTCLIPKERKAADYLKLKLSSCGLRRRFFWKIPAAVCLIAITLVGAAGVIRAGTPYNGRLSWYLDELKNTRWVTLEHDNVIKDGMDGVLEDIRQKVRLPDKICLVNSFNLHFAPDGTIRTLYAFINGYDEEGHFVDSCLISYDAGQSAKVRIDLHGSAGGKYEEEMDFMRLVEALRVIPLETVTAGWNQEEYGILYYGERTWSALDDNVIYINSAKEILEAAKAYRAGQEHTGYSVSVFCPEDEDIAPYRYLYVTQDEWEALEWGRKSEGGSAGSPEDKTMQTGEAADVNQTDNQTKQETSIEQETNPDEKDSIEKINKYMIPEQSFDVLLNDWGETKFVSCKPSSFDFEDASFYLVKGDQILYKFPFLYEDNISRGHIGLFESVGAVSFRDVNDDKKADIIIITYYVSGAGPTGMVPRPALRIFLAGENEFYLAEDMIAEVEENLSEKDMTIENICNFIKNKE